MSVKVFGLEDSPAATLLSLEATDEVKVFGLTESASLTVLKFVTAEQKSADANKIKIPITINE